MAYFDHPERPPRPPEPKVKLFELWERISARGTHYLSGYLGCLSIVGFSEERAHPKKPGERVTVWRIFASEQDRRPGGER